MRLLAQPQVCACFLPSPLSCNDFFGSPPARWKKHPQQMECFRFKSPFFLSSCLVCLDPLTNIPCGSLFIICIYREQSSWSYLLLVHILHDMQMMAFRSQNCCKAYSGLQLHASRFFNGQKLPFELFSSEMLYSTLFQMASRVVGSRSQALDGQRSPTDNVFPLWVIGGQGNKSSQDLGWTNYRSVLGWKSDNRTEGGRQERKE